MFEKIRRLSKLSRRKKVVFQLLIDAALVILSFVSAMLLRLESVAFLGNFQVWIALFVTCGAALGSFYTLGLYRSLVRYISGRALILISQGALVAAIALYAAVLVIDAPIPRSVPVIFFFLSFGLIGGLRFLARSFFRKKIDSKRSPVIIYGAGDAGLQLLQAIYHSSEYTPIALIDDDPSLLNMTLAGLRVSRPEEIPRLVASMGVQIILLALPNIGRMRRQEIVMELNKLNLEIKTIPSMSEIIGGEAMISELRTVSAEDLLGRDPIHPQQELLGRNICAQVVMVTGAGGSIGSELCRQILNQQPTVLLLFDVSEFALYTVESELSSIAKRNKFPTQIVPLLGSVQHRDRLEAAIKTFKVQTIYHAAAYKHVPLVEDNVVEGISNNVFGTLVVASAAKKFGVKNFILISTDKAVRPTNIMGATKRLAELICQSYARETSATVFSMVRFGNVLGSSGSVIPLFRSQIENGGPVTVTHKDITRYFMTIPEAAQLVIQAGALARGGDVFVLDMGAPVRILDLALSMIKLHGLSPYMVDHIDQSHPEKGDIPVFVTGLRKGEKLYEELLIGGSPSPTLHPRIMTASEVSVQWDELKFSLDRLSLACDRFDLPAIVAILRDLPLEYAPRSNCALNLLENAVHVADRGPHFSAYVRRGVQPDLADFNA